MHPEDDMLVSLKLVVWSKQFSVFTRSGSLHLEIGMLKCLLSSYALFGVIHKHALQQIYALRVKGWAHLQHQRQHDKSRLISMLADPLNTHTLSSRIRMWPKGQLQKYHMFAVVMRKLEAGSLTSCKFLGLHFGNSDCQSGRLETPFQHLSSGVPRVLKIWNSCPICIDGLCSDVLIIRHPFHGIGQWVFAS